MPDLLMLILDDSNDILIAWMPKRKGKVSGTGVDGWVILNYNTTHKRTNKDRDQCDIAIQRIYKLIVKIPL